MNAGGDPGTPQEERRAPVDAAVERAIGFGATKLRLAEERSERYFVMQDPEGNEFSSRSPLRPTSRAAAVGPLDPADVRRVLEPLRAVLTERTELVVQLQRLGPAWGSCGVC